MKVEEHTEVMTTVLTCPKTDETCRSGLDSMVTVATSKEKSSECDLKVDGSGKVTEVSQASRSRRKSKQSKSRKNKDRTVITVLPDTPVQSPHAPLEQIHSKEKLTVGCKDEEKPKINAETNKKPHQPILKVIDQPMQDNQYELVENLLQNISDRDLHADSPKRKKQKKKKVEIDESPKPTPAQEEPERKEEDYPMTSPTQPRSEKSKAKSLKSQHSSRHKSHTMEESNEDKVELVGNIIPDTDVNVKQDENKFPNKDSILSEPKDEPKIESKSVKTKTEISKVEQSQIPIVADQQQSEVNDKNEKKKKKCCILL